MFHAICIGIFYHENGEGEWRPVERYARSSRRSYDDIDLWEVVGVPLGQKSYGLDDVKKVYEYFEEKFPETYRILVFTEASGTSTVYNSGNNARHTICLYYHEGQFDLMKSPQKFFRKKHYCVDCEKTYENQADHTNCKIRCQLCFRNGYGYPCKGNLELECPDCYKLFPNQDCMDVHRPYLCNTYHRCVYCNVQYRMRPERPSKGHACAKPAAA
ncbi:hypothetical protein AAVH_07673 [Aphelenchoides avenae]|nr:hypothetical protein AAVH_07672 [Aphelenchus avenae]KAH7724804.1 hypothetical protein AAVH_07673 [Aphelenchus avenae]